MAKKRRSRDINQIAAAIVKQSTASSAPRNMHITKNPAAVALGRLGGLKGGKARAERLSPAQRKAIAKKAALGRWKQHA